MPRRNTEFWDGASFALRYVLAAIHILFGICFIVRPNIPLLFPAFNAFDTNFPASYWGWWSVIAALLLILIPTRVPWGLISTAFSTYLMFVIGITFGEGAGLIPGTTVYSIGCGGMGLLLFTRALWMYMVKVKWFQRLTGGRNRVRGPHARRID